MSGLQDPQVRPRGSHLAFLLNSALNSPAIPEHACSAIAPLAPRHALRSREHHRENSASRSVSRFF